MSVQTDLAVDGEAVSGESDRFDEDNDTGGYPQSPGGIQANGEAVDVVGPVQRADNVGDAGSEQPIERDSEQVCSSLETCQRLKRLFRLDGTVTRNGRWTVFWRSGSQWNICSNGRATRLLLTGKVSEVSFRYRFVLVGRRRRI